MKNVLLFGFFGHNNIGDDLLLLEALSKIPNNFKIYIKSSESIKDTLNEYIRYRCFEQVSSYRDLLSRNYEYLIYSGGGQFPTIYYGLKDYLRFFFIKLRCRKVIVNGCGIVPKPKSFFFKLFLNQLDYCSVRDDISADYVMNVRKDVVNCGDLYWGNDNHFKSNQTSRKCIVCLANPFSDNELKDPHFQTRYKLFIKNVSNIVQSIKEKGFLIEYLPFYQKSDEKLISHIQKFICSNDKVLLRGDDFELDTIDLLMSQYQLGFCMRFHSILLAVKNRLPLVAINYDYKSECLLKEAGLDEYGVRYGVRESQFFNHEIDLDMDLLYKALNYATSETEKFRLKAADFYRKKHESVLKNYNVIFTNI